jgi:hypothetical protein
MKQMCLFVLLMVLVLALGSAKDVLELFTTKQNLASFMDQKEHTTDDVFFIADNASLPVQVPSSNSNEATQGQSGKVRTRDKCHDGHDVKCRRCWGCVNRRWRYACTCR